MTKIQQNNASEIKSGDAGGVNPTLPLSSYSVMRYIIS